MTCRSSFPPLARPQRRAFLRAGGSGVLALGLLAACSREAAQAQTPAAPAVQQPDASLDLVSRQGQGFTIGAAAPAPTVYVFFDTTCPHCAHLWRASQPLLGRLRMVWMPVGLLQKRSAPQGAMILGAPDPAAAMSANEAAVLSGSPGLTPMGEPNAALQARVQANTALFRQLGADSVPLILLRNPRTGVAQRHEGAWETAELAAAAGV